MILKKKNCLAVSFSYFIFSFVAAFINGNDDRVLPFFLYNFGELEKCTAEVLL